MELNRKKFALQYEGRELSLEISDLAGQANASVLGTYGDSTVLATVVLGKKESDKNYFPLMVNFEERFYAVGKVLGSRFMRREGRPSDRSTLSGRVIDRVVRPLFDHKMRRDIQLVVTVLSLDREDNLDFLSLITASSALAISEIPWNGPVGGVRIVRKDGEFLINPKNTAVESFEFDSFVSGTEDKINMVELEGLEAKEEDIVAAFSSAQEEINKLVQFQKDIVAEVGKEKIEVGVKGPSEELRKKILAFAPPLLEEAIYIKDAQEREAATDKINEDLKAHLTDSGVEEGELADVYSVWEEMINDIVHKNILENDKRPDGRTPDEIRDLYSEVSLLKRTHGSGLFARGRTQALAVTTLGAPGDEQLIESMFESTKDKFLLHYNFPPYSVGEVGFFRGPGRRDIGHGALAKKALVNMLPEKEGFPYTIRIVSEILSSNGSSSMATVCASTLSMMDAGVPIKKPVAGIAMGLITDDKNNYKVLTDIQGYEDHYGDADFKVAGTTDGVTAIQMDVKIDGFDLSMLKVGLEKAKVARLKILEVMKGAIAEPRPELSPLAPLVTSMKISPEMIGLVIGPGGKKINEIIDTTGVLSIDIEDDGTVFVSGDNKAVVDAAMAEIGALTKEYAVGDMVTGEVVKLLEFGAIVQLDGGHDGMVHISEIKDGFVKTIEDVIKMGQKVKAKVIKSENGKLGLSMKGVDQG